MEETTAEATLSTPSVDIAAELMTVIRNEQCHFPGTFQRGWTCDARVIGCPSWQVGTINIIEIHLVPSYYVQTSV